MKRAKIPDVFKTRKKPKIQQQTSEDWGEEDSGSAVPTDCQAALMYLRSLINVEALDRRIPPIIIKHQLYNVIKNRTHVDKQVNELRDSKEIKLLKLGTGPDEFSIVFTKDYVEHVNKQLPDRPVVKRFLSSIVEKTNSVSVDKRMLVDHLEFKDEEITELVNGGVLNVRDVGSWWIAVPGAGYFIRHFTKGRDAILRTIRNSKYKQILLRELETRDLKATKTLGMQYHIQEILGSGSVSKFDTTSGTMVRIDS
ncbi:serine/threonine-protein kinase 19-like [Anneissia japonica]|uniref:serine/threonine-protein kinase 19-like n=1 Tax=Anneissia japonica TaxID=1529436 RepID=UPI001425A805|nr:serine/threonine-protein kinase 19-like [Anneissia japonica]